jgi:hypothetical protein
MGLALDGVLAHEKSTSRASQQRIVFYFPVQCTPYRSRNPTELLYDLGKNVV